MRRGSASGAHRAVRARSSSLRPHDTLKHIATIDRSHRHLVLTRGDMPDPEPLGEKLRDRRLAHLRGDDRPMRSNAALHKGWGGQLKKALDLPGVPRGPHELKPRVA